MAIVTDSELKAYMSGVRLPAAAVQSLPTIIDGTQGELETYLRYAIDADQPDVTAESVYVDRYGNLVTQFWPVAHVTSVTDAAGSPITYTYTDSGDFLIPGGGPFDTAGYIVTYRPGLPPRAFALAKLAIMRVASREVSTMHDDSRDPPASQDPNSRRPTDPQIGWQPRELRRFSRWRSRSGAVYSRPRSYLPGVGPSYEGNLTYNPGSMDATGVVSLTSAPWGGDATVDG